MKATENAVPKKRRGRPSKAMLAERAKAEEAKAEEAKVVEAEVVEETIPKGVCNGAGWEMIFSNNFERLNNVVNESKGTRHVPIQHHEALRIFKECLDRKGIEVRAEVGMLSQNQIKFVYTAEIGSGTTGDYTFIIGFTNYNDKTRSFSCFASERCLVCSNELITGLAPKEERVKHLKGSNEQKLIDKIDASIDRYEVFKSEREIEIAAMKEFKVGDNVLAHLILEMHESSGFYGQLIDEILVEYKNPRHEEFKPRTLWSFQNAYTELAKRFNPVSKAKTDGEFKEIVKRIETRFVNV